MAMEDSVGAVQITCAVAVGAPPTAAEMVVLPPLVPRLVLQVTVNTVAARRRGRHGEGGHRRIADAPRRGAGQSPLVYPSEYVPPTVTGVAVAIRPSKADGGGIMAMDDSVGAVQFTGAEPCPTPYWPLLEARTVVVPPLVPKLSVAGHGHHLRAR